MALKPLLPRPNPALYRKQARELLKAFEAQDAHALARIRRHHPRLPGRADTNDRNCVMDSEILRATFSLQDARHVIAHEHQFESWPKFVEHIAALNRQGSAVARFEAAVDSIVDGDEAALKKLLREDPALIRARSTREHRATLLHYVGANAVEAYRQKTPRNIARVAEILLKAGAEVDADLDYGPRRKCYPERIGSTTLALVATSCHPVNAGVQILLLDILIKYGAGVDGLQGGWNPVIAALHNGRGNAAAYLAKRGARLNLEAAAGAGRIDAVRTFFNESRVGELGSGIAASRQQMESGLMWACEYGHTRVVEFLVRKGVDVSSRPHGETGLHWAAYAGHNGVVKALLKGNPPVNAIDRRFNGTPLGWALYGWCDPPPEADPAGYYDVVALLVAAGATVEQAWLAKSRGGFPIAQKVRSDKRMLRALRK